MSLQDLILETMKQINGNTTGSMNANISDTVDLFIESLNTDSLNDKCERLLDEELGDVGLTSLNAKLQYWLIQRVNYEQGDSLEDLLHRYLERLYIINTNAIAHYINFTDNKWHDVVNGYDADLVNSNAFQSNGTDNSVSTGVDIAENTRVKCKFKMISYTSTDILFGSSTAEPRFYFGIDSTGAWLYGYNTQRTTFGAFDTDWHLIEIDSDGVILDGTSVVIGSATPFSASDVIELFSVKNDLFSNAEIAYIEIYDGETLIKQIVASAGIGDQLYDTDGNEYQIEGTINEGTQWVEQDEYHYNLLNGFDMYKNTSGEFMRVPVGSTVSQTGWAKVDTFIPGASYIPAETKFKLPAEADLIAADDGQFFTGGVPNALSYEDIINATAEQEILGIESTVGNDGQGQAVIKGLTVSYQEYTADVPNLGTLVFSSVLDDNYYDSLNGVIVTGTGSDITLTNATGETADMGVIHMTGQIATATASEMAQISASMEPGTDLQHVKNPILYSNGKNILTNQLSDWEQGTIDGSGSNFGSSTRIRTIDYERIGANTQHAVSAIAGYDIRAIYYYDKDFNFISVSGVSPSTITTPSNCKYIRVIARFTDNSTIIASEVVNMQLQLEPGSSATAYEPYKLSQMSILSSGGADLTQRSLPNGVADLSYPYLEKNVQNVDSKTLESSDMIALGNNPGNQFIVLAELPNQNIDIVGGSSIVKKANIANVPEMSFADRLTETITSGMEYYVTSGGIFALAVPLGTYSTLTDARNALSGNVTVDYMVAKPIITDAEVTIVDENGVSQDYWHLFAGGQITTESATLPPMIQYRNLQEVENIIAFTELGNRKQGLAIFEVDGLPSDLAHDL